MTYIVKTAEQRRIEIQNNAAKIGITDEYISILVDTFYARIRSHKQLGPIFDKAIGDHWDQHLAKLKDFWASVAMNAGRYSGQPVPVHKKLTDVKTHHFKTWLELFKQTLVDTAPHADVIPYFMSRAERIASSLQLAMYGVPELKIKRG